MSAVFSLPLLQILTGTDTSLGYRPRHFAPVSATVMSAATHPPIDPSAQCDILRRSFRAVRGPFIDPSAQCETRPAIHPRNALPAERSIRAMRDPPIDPSAQCDTRPSNTHHFVTETVSSALCLTSAVLSAVFSGHLWAILSAALSGLVSVCRLTSAVLSGVMFGSCLASCTACYGEHLLRCAERNYVATASTVLRRPSRRLCTFNVSRPVGSRVVLSPQVGYLVGRHVRTLSCISHATNNIFGDALSDLTPATVSTVLRRPSRRLGVSRRLFCRPSSRATCRPSCRRS